MINTQNTNLSIKGMVALGSSGLLALLLTAPALAHHPTGNQTPSTFIAGFLSGLGHPVIGLDHLAFVIAVGLLAATRVKGVTLPIAFVIAALFGTGIHLAEISLPWAEFWISASVLAIGLLIALGSQIPTLALAVLAGFAGIFHGYAYGESIIGATTAPLMAYLLGFTTIQLVIALGAFWIGRRGLEFKTATEGQPSSHLRKAGWAIGGMGLALTYSQVLG
ncbi:HupE/UreJ family protein [Phormidium sp. FACHB-1136]|uniref:HupE/UreJ family protein n=1 Tax=Phormidium sp. FACHB-1136 TaxID=2692848 RepID=UPI001686ED68|nr:HupE/UreJ family protein [Phormidium sp. FACHB-1136]MBD2429165.1 HupE/UreJ family protein [Phormidium sp. FACHB-1136]